MNQEEIIAHVLLAKNGDSASFCKLYELYYKDMYRFAYYTLGNQQDAEDVISETVLDAFKGIRNLRKPEKFKTWIFQILSTKCKRQIAVYISNREHLMDDTSDAEFIQEDLPYAEHLDDKYLNILNTFRPMEAVFMLHLGVDYDPNQFMRSSLSYCYGMYDLSKATEKLRSGIYHEGDDGFLIFIPSNHAKDFAPEGHHCITIYTVAPDTLKNASWEEKKQEYADKLIKLAEKHLPDLSNHITTMKIMTATDYQKYTHMKKSSFGGTVPIKDQLNPPHVTPVKNLYFVGQQSENGGGMCAVMMGAKDAYHKAFKK